MENIDVKLVLAVLIFVATFLLIIVDKIPHVASALGGGVMMIILGIISKEKAFHSIDFDVVFLLFGMMVIVHLLSETGFFEYVGIKIVKLSGGKPVVIMINLIVVTALLSAFLDNVTTILLITPISIKIANRMGITAIPFVISQIMASNIGGSATLIGDPPNILIGTKAGITFGEFIFHLSPIVIINVAVLVLTMWLFFRKKLKINEEILTRLKKDTKENLIKDKTMMIKSIVVLLIVLIGFFTHIYEPSIVALAGATFLIIISGKKGEHILRFVEWNTIFFFVGLFIIVEGLIEVGAIKLVAEAALGVTKGDIRNTSMLILWMSGFVSGIVDNIPYTATLIPMIKENILPEVIKQNSGVLQSTVNYSMWWALSLGACLGGNLTIIGASANVVGINIASRAGHHITFMMFLKYGIIIVAESLLLSSVYIIFRYTN